MLTYSKQACKRAQTLLSSLFLCLGFDINFLKSESYLMQQFSLLRMCWDTVDMSLITSDKLIEIHQLAHAFYRGNLLQCIRLGPFLFRPPCASGHA